MTDKKPVFDPTVNLGHLLTFFGFVAMIVGSWNLLDKRIIVLEEAYKAQSLRDTHQDERAAHNIQIIKESLTKIERNVERVNDRLDSRGM